MISRNVECAARRAGQGMLVALAALVGTRTVEAATEADLPTCVLSRSFTEDFNDLSVSPRVLGRHRWIAHTPWNGDFGDAAFADPGLNSPFAVKDGILSITASKDAKGKWRSGLLASADSSTRGFSQQYGYFESRVKMPEGPGVWPAFWLNASKPKGYDEPSIEVDIVEYYGRRPDRFHSVLHIWPKDQGHTEGGGMRESVPYGSLYDEFHTYGALVTPQTIRYYFDGVEYWQQPTPVEHKTPLMLLVNLALGPGWPIDKTPDPSVMQVDYVHAYALDAPADCLLDPAALPAE